MIQKVRTLNIHEEHLRPRFWVYFGKLSYFSTLLCDSALSVLILYYYYKYYYLYYYWPLRSNS